MGMMADWDSHIDRQIRKAMDEGQFERLPGEGKPLKLDDDPNTPDDLKLAYKILKENDLTPDWMLVARELDTKSEKLRERLRHAAGQYRSALVGADARQQTQAEINWQRAQTQVAVEVEKLNRDITTYNLKIPAGIPH